FSSNPPSHKTQRRPEVPQAALIRARGSPFLQRAPGAMHKRERDARQAGPGRARMWAERDRTEQDGQLRKTGGKRGQHSGALRAVRRAHRGARRGQLPASRRHPRLHLRRRREPLRRPPLPLWRPLVGAAGAREAASWRAPSLLAEGMVPPPTWRALGAAAAREAAPGERRLCGSCPPPGAAQARRSRQRDTSRQGGGGGGERHGGARGKVVGGGA
ncbi:unnamed protein product, partial [Prorocentrum cordatum]